MIYIFNKYLLNVYSVPSTGLDTEDSVINNADGLPQNLCQNAVLNTCLTFTKMNKKNLNTLWSLLGV